LLKDRVTKGCFLTKERHINRCFLTKERVIPLFYTSFHTQNAFFLKYPFELFVCLGVGAIIPNHGGVFSSCTVRTFSNK